MLSASYSFNPNARKCKRTAQMTILSSIRRILTCLNLFYDFCSRCLFCVVAGACVPDVMRFIFIRRSSLVSYTFLIVSQNLSAYMSREMSAASQEHKLCFSLCSVFPNLVPLRMSTAWFSLRTLRNISSFICWTCQMQRLHRL